MLQIFTSGSDVNLRSDLKMALVSGSMAAAVMGVLVVSVGQLSDARAQVLLEASLPTTRFLCSGLMTATATTLALMLTLLSMSGSTDSDIQTSHYRRIRQIALVDVLTFIGATFLLAVLMIPFSEVSGVPDGWYDVLYFAITGVASLLSGALVAVMLMLYAAARDLIVVYAPTEDNPLAAEKAEEAAEEAQEAADEAEDSEAEEKAEEAEEDAREAEEAASD